ncbi:MAG: hypothetical protein KY434_05765 [Actinobacteria bacterium]|nr:hypothetical protein [Actinomycetota bacterium]
MQAIRLPSSFDRPDGGGPVPTPTCCCCCCCCATTLAAWGTYEGMSTFFEGRRTAAPRRVWAVLLGVVTPVVAIGLGIAAAAVASTPGFDELLLLVPSAVVAVLAWFGLAWWSLLLAGVESTRARKAAAVTAVLGVLAFAAEVVVGALLLLWTFGIGYLVLLAGGVVAAVAMARHRHRPPELAPGGPPPVYYWPPSPPGPPAPPGPLPPPPH